MNFKSFARIALVSELLRQCFYNITKTVLQCFVHLVEVSFLIQRILHLFHPFRKLVSQVCKLHFKVIYTTHECVESLLANTTSLCFGYF